MIDKLTTLPKFLNRQASKEPIMPSQITPTTAPQPVESAVAKASELGDAVAGLIADRKRLTEEVAFLTRHNESLTDKLSRCEQERDFYIHRSRYFENFATGIVVNFDTIQLVIENVRKKAHESKLIVPGQETHPRDLDEPVEMPHSDVMPEAPSAEEVRLRDEDYDRMLADIDKRDRRS